MKNNFAIKEKTRGVPFTKCVENICLKIFEKFPEGRIFADWEKIVGETISTLCFPYKVSLPQKTIYLSVKYGAIIEVQYFGKHIINQVNTYLGDLSFENLKFKQESCIGKKNSKNNVIFTKKEFNINDESIDFQLNRLWHNLNS